MQKNENIVCFTREDLKPITLNHYDRFLHTIVMGPTGCGKSALIFTPLIIQDIINRNCGITLFDPKEDLVEKVHAYAKSFCGDRLIYINPLDPNCPKINPMSGDIDTVTKNLLTIFSPTFATTSLSEKFEIDINRMLIIKTVKLLKSHPNLIGNILNLKTYNDFLSNKNNLTRPKCSKLLELLQNQERDPECVEILEWFLRVYLENKEGVMDKCFYLRGKIEQMISNKYILNILTPGSNETNLIDFNKHLLEGDIVLINTKSTILGPLGKTFGEFLMLEYTNCVFKRHVIRRLQGQTRSQMIPNFLYIDEFTTYSPVTLDLFLQGRSFKIGIHIAIQDRHMLQVCGGEQTITQAYSIETNCRNLIVFPGVSGETAIHYAKEFFNYSAEEIIYRPFGQVICRLVKENNVIAPMVGLVFFMDQKPNKDSLKYEYNFVKTPDGSVAIQAKNQDWYVSDGPEEDDLSEFFKQNP